MLRVVMWANPTTGEFTVHIRATDGMTDNERKFKDFWEAFAYASELQQTMYAYNLPIGGPIEVCKDF